MALSGTLVADFNSFYTAVQQAKAELTGFDKDAKSVGDSLSQMADRFSGTKIISEGLEINRLFQSMDDVALLTKRELTEVGNTANEAIEKMQRLGLEVPKNLENVARAANDAAKESEGFGISWGKIFETFAGFSLERIGEKVIDTIADLGKEAFETADHLQKLHEQTGISVEALQNIQDVAERSGVSLQSVAGAVETLQQRLGSGNKGAAAALDELGLSFDKIASEKPEQQFADIARAMGELKDPLDFARVGAELFGLKWKEIAPAIKAAAEGITDNTWAMSRDTVKALADAKSSWDSFWRAVTAQTGEVIADVLTGTTSKMRAFQGEMDGMVENVKKQGPELAASIAPPGLPADLDAITKALQDENRQININREDAAMATDTAIALAGTFADVRKKFHDEAMKQAKELADEQKRQLDRTNADTKTALDQMQKMRADVTDADMKASMSETDYKVAKVWQWAQQTIDAYKGTGAQAAAYADLVYTRAGQMQDAIYATTKQIDDQGDAYAQLAKDAVTTFAEIGSGDAPADAAVSHFGGTLVIVSDNLDDLNRKLSTFYDQFTQFGDMSGATMGVGAAVGGYRVPQARAAGGPVSGGTTYLVGERGPELFTPASSGSISPGASVTNHFYINGSIKDLAQPLLEEITRVMRQTRQWPSAT